MIIFRYLSKEILTMMLVVTLVVMIILVTNQSVRFLRYAAGGAVPATQLLHMVALQIPLLLGYLIPLGLYLAILLTLARLHADSEMVVLSACGMSRVQITGIVFTIALGVATFVFWLMAYAVPKAQGDMNDIYNMAAARASVAQIIPGRFMTFGDPHRPLIFYAKKVEKSHSVLRDVFLARKETDSQQGGRVKWDIVIAKTAFEKIVPHSKEHYLVFANGYRYFGVPGEKNYRIFKFEEYGVHLAVKNLAPSSGAQYASFSQLWKTYSTDRQAASELQWRLAMPISTLIFALLAVPLSEVRPRYGKFTQLFPAMAIYLLYADGILYARRAISYGFLSPALGMWWIHGAALLLAIVLMLYRVGWLRLRQVFA